MPENNKKLKKRKTIKKRKNSNFKIAFFLALAILAIYFAYEPIKLRISYKMAGIYQAEIGTIEQGLIIDKALFLRDEVSLNATASGVLVQLVSEGQRVAEKELLARIQTYQGEIKEIIAPKAGVVCYHLDGLEGTLEPETIMTLNAAEGNFGDYQLTEINQGSQVIKGQPLLKLVNNLKPIFLMVNFDSKNLEQFPSPGKKVLVRFNGQEYQATIKEIETQGINVSALLELNKGEFLHEREIGISLVLENRRGIKVPNTALVDTEEGKAAYKLFATGYRLVPVKILLQNNEDCIVDGLSRGDRILRNPNIVKALSGTSFGE